MPGTSGEETIEITISEDGSSIDLDAKGFSGKGCSIALNELTKALGEVSRFTKKADYYNKDKNENVIINTR